MTAANAFNATLYDALADPKVKARLADLVAVPLVISPTDFGKLIVNETDKWAKVIRTANIKPE
jgi:tripartite-type tricarboxylate transporter receptor subunit TctC